MKLAGRYRLLNPLGEGTVRLAFDEVAHRDVAVRDMRAQPAEEARRALQLRHPSIVPLLDLVEEEGGPWLVTEFVSGASLARTVDAKRPLPELQAARAGLCLLEALTTAHGAGIVHGNLNPGKVMLTATGRAVLTGFGLPHPGLRPPADLWSLAATLHFAVEGRPPGAAPATDPEPLRALIRAMLDPAGPPSLDDITSTLTRLALNHPITTTHPLSVPTTGSFPPTPTIPSPPPTFGHPAPPSGPPSPAFDHPAPPSGHPGDPATPAFGHPSPPAPDQPAGPGFGYPGATAPPVLGHAAETPPMGTPVVPHPGGEVAHPGGEVSHPSDQSGPAPDAPEPQGEAPNPPAKSRLLGLRKVFGRRRQSPPAPENPPPTEPPLTAPPIITPTPEPPTHDQHAPFPPPQDAPHPQDAPPQSALFPQPPNAPSAPSPRPMDAPPMDAPFAPQSPDAFPTPPDAPFPPPQAPGPFPPPADDSYPTPPVAAFPASPADGFPTPPSDGFPTPPAQNFPTPPAQNYPTPPVEPAPLSDMLYPSPSWPVAYDPAPSQHRPRHAAPGSTPVDRALDQVIGTTGPLPPVQVAAIGLAVLDQLVGLHARGEHHGDIRPGNILLSPSGQAILSPPLMPNGISAYTAPEGATGPAADMWSLGATLFAAVEGLPPAPGAPLTRAGALAAVLYALLAGDPAARPAPAPLRQEFLTISQSLDPRDIS
ncbi:protein kinase domain-containing protein [Nonomuraea endophytica]|uniref:Serine/threonine protein kinase n=1 Tax=Nonomuraea endophytica TaxID=714136 RepID=A0A7W7ZW53_9ACTN|nr:protein kinase [Nonomuraea endophytica]MBB5074584.1 serine/threonine protein kinase [Nonomuraea endophytica]